MITREENFTLKSDNLPASALPFNMIWVNQGEFTMGHDKFNKKLIYNHLPIDGSFDVIISRGFWLGEFIVTQAHWDAFKGSELGNVSTFADRYNEIARVARGIDNLPLKSNLPMYLTIWKEAMLFCRALNHQYKDYIPDGYHFSLPTEAQWEYACRATLSNPEQVMKVSKRGYISNLSDFVEVNESKPNKWGFNNMLDVISEYCFDLCEYYVKWEDEIIEYPNYKGKLIDWLPCVEPSLCMSSFGLRRVVRGAFSPIYRQHDSGNFDDVTPFSLDGPWGFRVALRPITKSDVTDPLLKMKNIDMLDFMTIFF